MTLSEQLGVERIEIIYNTHVKHHHYIELDLIDGNKWYYFVRENKTIILYENSNGTNLLMNNNIIIL